MLASARLAVVVILRRLRRDRRTRRCISYGAAGLKSWRQAQVGKGDGSVTEDTQRYPWPSGMAHSTLCQISFGPPSPRGRFEHRFLDMPPRVWSARSVCENPTLGRPPTNCAGAPLSMTRSVPRRASVRSFANCDGGGHDRLRPVSSEKRPSRIEQRTSAHASFETFRSVRSIAPHA